MKLTNILTGSDKMIVLNNEKFAENEKEFTDSLFVSGGTCVGYAKGLKRQIKLYDAQKNLIGIMKELHYLFETALNSWILKIMVGFDYENIALCHNSHKKTFFLLNGIEKIGTFNYSAYSVDNAFFIEEHH
jgi:hypothetical protein